MVSAFCPDHQAHKDKLLAHDKRLDSHSRAIDEAEDERHSMELAIQKIADLEELTKLRIDQNDAALEKHEQRIQALEDRPANDAKRIKDAALASVGGAIGTGIIGLVAIAASKTIS